MTRLENKTALVTGAGRGIGRGIAIELAKAGADVVVADIQLDNALAVVNDIAALGKKAMAIHLDVTDDTSVASAVQHTFDQFSPHIDILVNNAGVFQRGVGLEINIDDFDYCNDVNLKGIWRVSQTLIPHFKSHHGGKIINIASIAGRRGMGPAAYCASKAAVISLTQSLANLLGPDNINVNAVCPGAIWTPMMAQIESMTDQTADADQVSQKTVFTSTHAQTPLGRPQTPEDIGYAVTFFASPQASNITGQALNVDGGMLMN